MYLWLHLQEVFIDMLSVNAVWRLVKRYCWFPEMIVLPHFTSFVLSVDHFCESDWWKKSWCFLVKFNSLALIDLLYFGSNCLLISFTFYIYNDINHIILLQVFIFLFIFQFCLMLLELQILMFQYCQFELITLPFVAFSIALVKLTLLFLSRIQKYFLLILSSPPFLHLTP